MIKIIKASNGNVRLFNGDGNLIASFTSAQNVFKHPRYENALVLTSSTSVNDDDKSYTISFNSVDKSNSVPQITATNIDELITELSDNFFFEAH